MPCILVNRMRAGLLNGRLSLARKRERAVDSGFAALPRLRFGQVSRRFVYALSRIDIYSKTTGYQRQTPIGRRDGHAFARRGSPRPLVHPMRSSRPPCVSHGRRSDGCRGIDACSRPVAAQSPRSAAVGVALAGVEVLPIGLRNAGGTFGLDLALRGALAVGCRLLGVARTSGPEACDRGVPAAVAFTGVQRSHAHRRAP